MEFKSLVAKLATVVIGRLDPKGHELSCILGSLTASPVAEKVVAELKKHRPGGPDSKNVTADDLSNLVHVAAVTKEDPSRRRC